MVLKHVLAASTAAFALAVGSATLADQPKTPFVSGDEPMDVGQSAQIKAPAPNAQAQQKTQEMLKKESQGLSGDYPADVGAAAQMKKPVPNAQEQEATEKDLKKENTESGAITGKYE
jgi:hypothetical protein